MKQGFTLMELMIVIVLLGVLTTMGIASFTSTRAKGNDLRRKSDLSSIAKALETYHSDHGGYPVDDGVGGMRGCSYGSGFPVSCNWGGEWKDNNGTYYMVLLPADPTGGKRYFYSSDGTFFQLYTLLQSNLDIDLKRDGSNAILYYDATVCATGKRCNYGVSSTNTSLTAGHTQTTSP